jgi:uncharacterized membrane protein YjfL (UPF0719 family)
MPLRRLAAIRPSRRFTSVFIAVACVFAWVTFSDDWQEVCNAAVSTTAISVAGGILVGALVIRAMRVRD